MKNPQTWSANCVPSKHHDNGGQGSHYEDEATDNLRGGSGSLTIRHCFVFMKLGEKFDFFSL
jgi:hypothetical protein